MIIDKRLLQLFSLGARGDFGGWLAELTYYWQLLFFLEPKRIFGIKLLAFKYCIKR